MPSGTSHGLAACLAIDFKKKIFCRGGDEPPPSGTIPAKGTSLPWCLWRTPPLCSGRFTLTASSRKAGDRPLKPAQQQGGLRQVKSSLALLAVGDGRRIAAVARVLRVHDKTVAAWGQQGCCAGLQGAPYQKPTGRPPNLRPPQKADLVSLLDAGPVKAGLCRACWRSPLIQQRIDARWGIFDPVFCIAQWLKNLGLRSHQAACVAAQRDEGQRQAWCPTTWPQMVRLAQARRARLRFGDEAAFPQGGTLSATWARRGHQPLVKTSGNRKGDNVFGVLAYRTGRCRDQGQDGRLTSAAYITCLTHVLEQTTPPIILIQEGARYHTAAALPPCFTLPTDRITVFQWPSSSPDDQPSEKLRKKGKKDGTQVQDFPMFEALTDHVDPAWLTFAHPPAEMLSLCRLPAALTIAA